MESMHFTFNTGRWYELRGQIITVYLHERLGGKVQFTDHSRGISGMTSKRFPTGRRSPFSLARSLEVKRACLVEWLMHEYDQMRYRWTESDLQETVPVLPFNHGSSYHAV
jgi:hypothetical protein